MSCGCEFREWGKKKRTRLNGWIKEEGVLIFISNAQTRICLALTQVRSLSPSQTRSGRTPRKWWLRMSESAWTSCTGLSQGLPAAKSLSLPKTSVGTAAQRAGDVLHFWLSHAGHLFHSSLTDCRLFLVKASRSTCLV